MKNVPREEKTKELLKTGIYKPEELDLLQDEILDDLYLKNLITTGQLSIKETDRPFVTYYPWRPARFLEINKSLYDTYVDASKDNQKGVAIYNYDDDRILYHNEVKELTDAFARGLMEYGVGIDSKVGIIANDATEEPMGLLAPNALGARVKFLDYFKGPAMKADIEKSHIDILFIDEMFIDWEPLLNEKGLPVVVLNATRDYSNTRYITFDKLVAMGASKNSEDLKKHKAEVDNLSHNRPVLEINSSGTTGIPKPILHSHSSINSATQKLYFTGFPFGKDSYVLKSIPSQLGLGSLTSLYSCLLSGTGLILIRPESKEKAFNLNVKVINEFRDIMKKYGLSEQSILMNFASPMFYRGIQDQISEIGDMSHIGGFLAAGSKMNKNELIEMNKQFKEKGCPVPVNNAYGQNELGGGVTMNTPKHDIPGSAGYPVIGTDVAVVNKNTGEKLPLGTEGSVVERSSSQFLGYEGMKEKTEEVKIKLSDGKEWFDTKDVGYFDSNNFIYITRRDFRVITNSDFKLSLDGIQDKLLSLGIFREVAVVPLEKGPDEFPVLFAKLKEDHKDMSLEDTTKAVQSILGPYEMPIKIILVDKLPSLPSGKIDYMSIESISKQLPDLPSCKVDIDTIAKEAGVEINKVPTLKLSLKK